MTELPEKNESLWIIAAAPAIWGAHFLLCYVTAAVWCAKVVGFGGSLHSVRIFIAAYTVIALAGILLTAYLGYRKRSLGGLTMPVHEDTPEDRHRFLGHATLLLSALSFVATVFVALNAVFFVRCY